MDPHDHRLINVGVELTREIPVDTISVNIDLQGTHKTRSECTDEYNVLLKEVREALVGIGIPADEIKNDDFRITPHTEELYKKDEDGDYYIVREVARGYEYTAGLSLKLPFADLDDAKAIWAALMSCGEEVTFSIDFCLADEDGAKCALLADAVAEGRRRAEILAAAAGAHITGIHTIDYEYGSSGYRGGYMRTAADFSTAPYGSAPDFNPSDEKIECSVRMQWRMELG